ncbi:ABC transporter substrate-binding protein [Streptacidiphilus monticola]
MPAGKHVRRTVSWLAATAAALLVGATTAGCGADATAAENSTVTVMTWAPLGSEAGSEPAVPVTAQAIAQWINDTGGIGGRTLRVITCDERDTAEGAQACATQAVQQNVAAVVGSYSQFGDSFMPVLSEAGIPYLGGAGLSDTEFSAPTPIPSTAATSRSSPATAPS